MSRTGLAFAAASAIALGTAGPAVAEDFAKGYRFEAVDPHVQHSRDAEVLVRLVHVVDNKPVTGAVINEHRFEMFMSGTKIVTSLMVEGREPPPILAVAQGNGVYRLHAQLPMAGDWRATLTAHVPGEALPVRDSVTIRAR